MSIQYKSAIEFVRNRAKTAASPIDRQILNAYADLMVTQKSGITGLEYKSMFMAAVETIAQISDALGISEEDAATANGADLILEKIEFLRLRANTSTCACGSALCDGDHDGEEGPMSPEQAFWEGKL